MPSPFVFLSHSGADTDDALALARRIEDSPAAREHGLRVWIDVRDLPTGGDWKLQLQEAMATSTAFAVYVGSKGVVNWVWDEVKLALDRVHADPAYPLIPILAAETALPNLPSLLTQYQGVRDVERDGDAFARLIRGVLRMDTRAPIEAEREPFQGLEAFDSAKVHLFFGRETETEEVVSLLRDEHLVMVVGDSGSGKSSLVKAGLIPRFRGGAFVRHERDGRDETRWQVFETRPLGDPFGKLAAVLRDAATARGRGPKECNEVAELVRTMQASKIKDALHYAAGGESKIMLVVDQFEELFTLADIGAGAAFADMLASIADPVDDSIRVVLTMRWDYYHLCSAAANLYARLEAHDRRGRYTLRRMSAEGLRRCITEPLRLASVSVDDREQLVKAILRDVDERANDLTLLEMALSQTWRKRNEYGGDLLRTYVAIGRADGALANAAELAYHALTASEQALAEPLFVRLVKLGDFGAVSRRVARRDELEPRRQTPAAVVGQSESQPGPTATTAWELAQKLAGQSFGRLVLVTEDTAEIAHEALVRSWPRYASWLRDDVDRDNPRGEDKRHLDRLIDDARRWSKASDGDRVALLAKGYDLAAFETLAARRCAWLAAVEVDYIAASSQAKNLALRLRRVVAALLVAMLFSLALFSWQTLVRLWEQEAIIAWSNLGLSDEEEDLSEAQTRALWAVATLKPVVRSRFFEQLGTSSARQIQLGRQPIRTVNAAAGLDPERARIAFARVIDAMGQTKDNEAQQSLGAVAAHLEPRLAPEAVCEAWGHMMRMAAALPNADASSVPQAATEELAARLPPEQTCQAWAPFIGAVTRGWGDSRVAEGITAPVVGRLLDSERIAAFNDVIGRLPSVNAESSQDERSRRGRLLEVAEELAKKLPGNAAATTWTALLEQVKKDWDVEPVVLAISRRMPPEARAAEWVKLFDAVLDPKTGDTRTRLRTIASALLEQKLPVSSTEWERVLDAASKADTNGEWDLIDSAVRALPGDPPRDRIVALWNEILTEMEPMEDENDLTNVARAGGLLAALSERLTEARTDPGQPSSVASAWYRLWALRNRAVQRPEKPDIADNIAPAAAALAGRLPQDVTLTAWKRLVNDIASWTTTTSQILPIGTALADRLSDVERGTAMDLVIVGVGSNEYRYTQLALLLAPRLSSTHSDTAWKRLITQLQNTSNHDRTYNAAGMWQLAGVLATNLPEKGRSKAWSQLMEEIGSARVSAEPNDEQAITSLAASLPKTDRPAAWTTFIDATFGLTRNAPGDQIYNARSLEMAGKALAKQMDEEQAREAWKTLMERLKQAARNSASDRERYDTRALADVATTLAHVLPFKYLAEAWPQVPVLSGEGVYLTQRYLRDAQAIIAERQPVGAETPTWMAVFELLMTSDFFAADARDSLVRTLASRARHLHPTQKNVAWAAVLKALPTADNDRLMGLVTIAEAFQMTPSQAESHALWSSARNRLSNVEQNQLLPLARSLARLPGKPDDEHRKGIAEELGRRLNATKSSIEVIQAAGASACLRKVVEGLEPEANLRLAIHAVIAQGHHARGPDEALREAIHATHADRTISEFTQDVIQLLKFPTVGRGLQELLIAVLRERAAAESRPLPANDSKMENELALVLDWVRQNAPGTDLRSLPKNPCVDSEMAICQ